MSISLDDLDEYVKRKEKLCKIRKMERKAFLCNLMLAIIFRSVIVISTVGGKTN